MKQLVPSSEKSQGGHCGWRGVVSGRVSRYEMGGERPGGWDLGPVRALALAPRGLMGVVMCPTHYLQENCNYHLENRQQRAKRGRGRLGADRSL